jgi:gluconate 2-dehydrogenase alpha chain
MPDVVVVGLGPAGIVAARVLANAGHSVLAFQPEAAPPGRAALSSPPPTLRSGPDEEAVPQPAPPPGLDGIGGSKRLAAAQAYRLDDWSFRMRSETERRYGTAAAADLVDWPIDAEDLAPWYARLEEAMQVGPRAGTPWTDRMHVAAADLGWQPFPAPAAGSPDASPLLAGVGIDIVRATVTAVLLRPTGEVAGVEYIDGDGETRTLACGAVVVAASVLPTIRLLLLSGLTADGQVGRWFLSHSTFVVHGEFAGTDLRRRDAGPAAAVAVAEFEGDGFDHAGLGFLGGSLLQAAMTGPWSASRIDAAAEGLSRRTTQGLDAAAWVRAHHRSIGSVWAQPDQLPRAHNTVDLDPDHRDASGRPVARVTFSLADDDRRRWEFLSARAAEWLEAAGARSTWRPPLRAQPLGTHLYGGARMGEDRTTSVVDSHGRFHGVPGLVIVGSSTFPSTGGRGPVETIEALSWRAASQLAADLR